MDRDIFNTGRFSVPSVPGPCTDISAYTPDARRHFTDSCPPDTSLVAFGFHVVKGPQHASSSELQPLRAVGDDLADAAAFTAQRSHAGTTGTACPITHSTLDTVLQLAATGDAAATAFIHACSTPPAWYSAPRVAAGQRALRRHLPGYLMALFNLSLLGGFGAPQINAVLAGTGYLTSNPDRTVRRLFETFQMFTDVMRPGALDVGQRGWRSVLAVRLLHASVRVWLRGRLGGWDARALGQPINQEDLIVTQLAFSVVPLMGLERLRLADGMSEQDMLDVLHMWRYIGYLSGIREECLPPRVAEYMTSIAGAAGMLASISVHIVEPNDDTRRIVMHVLDSMSYMPPTPRSQAEHAALTRLFAGDAYADALGVPRLDDPAFEQHVLAAREAYEAQHGKDGSPSLGRTFARFFAWIALEAMLWFTEGVVALCGLFSSARGGLRLQRRVHVTPLQRQAERSAARVLQPARLYHMIGGIPWIGDWFAKRALTGFEQLVIARLGARTDFTVHRPLKAEGLRVAADDGRKA